MVYTSRNKRVWCGAHHRTKPCQSCRNSASASRIVWQSPERRAKHRLFMAEQEMAWTDEELEIIRKNAGLYCTRDITRFVNEYRQKYRLRPRHPHSIAHWSNMNGVKLNLGPMVYTMSALMRVLSISSNSILSWRKAGFIKGRSWGRFLIFDQQEVIEFVRTYPWLIDIEKIVPGSIRQVAEMTNRRDPWLKTSEIAALIPAKTDAILGLIHSGAIIAHQRFGHNSAFMIQASSVLLIRELLHNRKPTRSPRPNARQWVTQEPKAA